jgi:predicted nucleotidyltransferase
MHTLREVFTELERLHPELVRRHVRRIGVFGSLARGSARTDSDIDFLVELTEEGDLFDIVGIKRVLEERLGTSVDVVPIGGLKDDVRDVVLREVRYAA